MDNELRVFLNVTDFVLPRKRLLDKAATLLQPAIRVCDQQSGQMHIVKGDKPPRVKFAVETRTGNKKVTIIRNLSAFFINNDTFAHEINHAAASSATLSDDKCL